MIYKAGDRVAIYEDPMTCIQFKGMAVLVKRIAYDPERGELWKVRFEDEKETHERWIKVRGVV